jgi:hypothetical protein
MCSTCIKCVGFAIPPPPSHLEKLPMQNLEYLNWGSFTYFRFSKDFTIPSQHIKTTCLQPMLICNTFTHGDDNHFNLALINLLHEQDQVSCNTFILFFLDCFESLGGLL